MVVPRYCLFFDYSFWKLRQIALLQALIDKLQKENSCLFGEMSTLTGNGVMQVRNKACDSLLAYRVESKLNSGSKKADDILSRLHVAMPQKRDNKVSFIWICKATTSVAGHRCCLFPDPCAEGCQKLCLTISIQLPNLMIITQLNLQARKMFSHS